MELLPLHYNCFPTPVPLPTSILQPGHSLPQPPHCSPTNPACLSACALSITLIINHNTYQISTLPRHSPCPRHTPSTSPAYNPICAYSVVLPGCELKQLRCSLRTGLNRIVSEQCQKSEGSVARAQAVSRVLRVCLRRRGNVLRSQSTAARGSGVRQSGSSRVSRSACKPVNSSKDQLSSLVQKSPPYAYSDDSTPTSSLQHSTPHPCTPMTLPSTPNPPSPTNTPTAPTSRIFSTAATATSTFLSNMRWLPHIIIDGYLQGRVGDSDHVPTHDTMHQSRQARGCRAGGSLEQRQRLALGQAENSRVSSLDRAILLVRSRFMGAGLGRLEHQSLLDSLHFDPLCGSYLPCFLWLSLSASSQQARPITNSSKFSYPFSMMRHSRSLGSCWRMLLKIMATLLSFGQISSCLFDQSWLQMLSEYYRKDSRDRQLANSKFGASTMKLVRTSMTKCGSRIDVRLGQGFGSEQMEDLDSFLAKCSEHRFLVLGSDTSDSFYHSGINQGNSSRYMIESRTYLTPAGDQLKHFSNTREISTNVFYFLVHAELIFQF